MFSEFPAALGSTAGRVIARILAEEFERGEQDRREFRHLGHDWDRRECERLKRAIEVLPQVG